MSLREKDGGGGNKSPKNSQDTYELTRFVLGAVLALPHFALTDAVCGGSQQGLSSHTCPWEWVLHESAAGNCVCSNVW